jgi:effector-binding domain-containing protein
MKTFRRILFAIIAIIVILISVGFLLPRHVHVERKRVLKAPKGLIFDQVNNFRNWKKWSPWQQIDTNMIVNYFGPESGTASSFTYASNNSKLGSGKLTIISSIAFDSIIMEMDFMENGKSTGKFLFTASDTGTLVTWVMESDLGFNPVSRWFGLFIDKMVGKDLEKGISNLQILTDAIMENSYPKVLETEVPARIILTISDTCSSTTIGSKLDLLYGKISEVIKENKLTISGAPFSIYHSYSKGSIEMEAGLPVSSKIETKGEINCREIPPQKVVMVSFFGPYEKSSTAYQQIEKFIKDKQLSISGSPWEEYITDPQLEPDTSKWQTDIYFPVK